ncbi:MAG: ATPase, T2SS/T4P/T4SS family [Acidimicrobiia bacterium]|nr:ATPase, T2SS/T4P/T4SS family [Acidimicrobiia bacterium]
MSPKPSTRRRRTDRVLSPYEQLRNEVTEGIKNARLDPELDPSGVREFVLGAIEQWQSVARQGLDGKELLARPEEMAERILRYVLEYGPLTAPLSDPGVEEIFIEGDDIFYIDGGGYMRGVSEVTTADENLAVVRRLLQDSGREVTEREPMVQARVLDGTVRLGVVIPPIADKLSVTIRKYTMRNETLSLLVVRDSMDLRVAELLWAAVRSGLGILVCGRPGAGKTTLLNALLRAVPPTMVVRCVEEIRELSAPVMAGSYYQTRPAGADGDVAAEVSLRDLVRTCLGMRPDLLVVGEVRGAEAFELVRAGNAGCGVIATVHSNNPFDALSALRDTAIMAGGNVAPTQVQSTFQRMFHLVVFVDREELAFDEQGGAPIRRQVMEVSALMPNASGEDFLLQPLFVRERIGEPLRWTETDPADTTIARLDATLKRYESSTAQLLRGTPANVVPRDDAVENQLAPRPPVKPTRRRGSFPVPVVPSVSLSVEPGTDR